MYSKAVMKGLYVPLITPFNEDQSINWDGLYKMIDYVIDGGIDGILIGGTTGEYHMMSVEERKELIKKGCEYVNGRVPVMAGTGMTTAKATIEMNNYAAACGAKWGLVLPPYYHFTTDEKIYEFFKEIAEGSDLGICVYYTPGSTNVEMSPALLACIAQIEGIAAIKETVDETHTWATYMAIKDIPDVKVVEANEPLLLPSFSIGIDAAFSIIFNLLPKQMHEMYDKIFVENDVKAAAELNRKYYPIFAMMEEEPYPGPVKCALNLIGMPAGRLRDPLPETSEDLKNRMREELIKLGFKVVK